MAAAVFAAIALLTVVQLFGGQKRLPVIAARPGMCATWTSADAVAEFVRGADDVLYFSDAPLMRVAERQFCLQKDVAPVPVRRTLGPAMVLRVPGDVVVLSEMTDLGLQSRFFEAIAAGAGPQRRVERAQIGSFAVMRLR